MYTKFLAFILQTYFVSKASFPPNQNLSFKKVMSTEGIVGLLIGNILPLSMIVFITIQSIIYMYTMYQQEIGLIPTLSNRFSSWSLLEITFFLCAIGGASLRLWCFRCLNRYFTFNVTVKNNHELITTGPYSYLVHPSYTGGILMFMNVIYVWYKLYSYAPVYFPGSFGSSIRSISLWNIVGQTLFISLVYRRVFYEEKVLKKHFKKKWDIYFSQRKRFIPFIL